MLDDLKYIHQRDSQDALGIAQRQWQQLSHKFELNTDRLRVGGIKNVVYAGMGGSALASLLSKSWPGWKVPFEVCRQYHIPSYVTEDTLFIASSYSGNTEETLSALKQAEQKSAHIVVIASGGELKRIAEQKNYPLLLIPSVTQPRYSALYMLNGLAHIADAAGVSAVERPLQFMLGASEFLNRSVAAWEPTVPTVSNPAKKLAVELAGKSIVIYAGPLMAPVAYKWKISFNENAKTIAWWNELPEFDHNELTGWSSHPIEKTYGVVELRSSLEHERVQKRFEVGERVLSGMRPSPHVVSTEGTSLLEQVVWGVAFGDFVSIYLALLNGVNPAPIDLVEKLKTELNK